jgi:cysteine peptidase B
MRVFLVAAVALLVMAVSVLGASTASMRQMFEDFKAKYNRKYASASEEASRFAVFAENMRVAAKLQASNPLATFGVNEYADMSAKEFKSRHNGDKYYARAIAKSANEPRVDYSEAEKVAGRGRAIDWRAKGAVTYVKNQGQCGSCWSFSTTGGIEGQWFLAGNALVALSEQEFVSCDTIDQGCNGGLMDNAYTWVLEAHNGSIVTEASYPYVSGEGEVPACNMQGTVFGAQITGYENIAKNEDSMANWVYANGPLSIAVDATSFQTYTGGILTNCISQQIDHGVLIVGFDDNNNPPYWIIKNSWGKSWGEAGYIRVEKGTDQCLITSYPCSAKAAKSGPTPPPPPPGKKQFTQLRCADPKCGNCTSVTLPQDECISGIKYSYKASCASSGLTVKSFTGRTCTGSPISTVVNPVGQCDIDFDSTHTESFVQNLCGAAPPPPTPAPPVATFTQQSCQDSACSIGCVNSTYNLNTCLALENGGSAIATCTAEALVLTEFPTSAKCTGFQLPTSLPLNQCLQSGDGQSYYENFCGAQGVASSGAKKLMSGARKQ